MLKESDVKLLLSTHIGDPIMDGSRVTGLFVENKLGRGALKAKVVIDGTDEADVARRAGAPILLPKNEYGKLDGHSPTGMGLYFTLWGVDWKKAEAFQANTAPTDADTEWALEAMGEGGAKSYSHLLSALRKSYDSGYRLGIEVDLGAHLWESQSRASPGPAHLASLKVGSPLSFLPSSVSVCSATLLSSVKPISPF